MKYTEDDVKRSEELLREWLRPDDRIYCVIRSAARSGMSRTIQLFRVACKDDVVPIGYHVARYLGYHWNANQDGIVVSGCGMDMGFALVSNLSHRLFSSDTSLRHTWL